MKGRNGTPRSWSQRHDAWKYGNRPPLDVDPLHVPEDSAIERPNSALGWALVALVVVGVVLLIVREVVG